MSKELEKKINKVLEELLKDNEKERIQMFDCTDIFGDFKICLFDEDGVEVLYAPRI